MIFDAGCAFDTRRDVDAVRPHAADGGGGVVGVEPPREDDAAPVRDRRRRCPVDRPPGASALHRIVDVEEECGLLRPPLVASFTLADGDRLEHRRGEPRRVLRRLVAMELHDAEPHEAGDTTYVVHGLIHEHADSRDKRRQRRSNRPRSVRIDEPRAVGPEDEPDRPRARIDSGHRVLTTRDAANLYHHPADSKSTAPQRTRWTQTSVLVICEPQWF